MVAEELIQPADRRQAYHYVAGGRLHISALVYPADPLVLIDEAFASDRAATIEQTIDLVKAAGAAA